MYWCLWVKVLGLYMSRTLALFIIMEIAGGILTSGDRDFPPEVTVRLSHPPPGMAGFCYWRWSPKKKVIPKGPTPL